MLKQFKRLASHSVVYGMAAILNAAIGFVLTPLYARYLTPSDYGVVTISTNTAAFAAMFFQLGTGTAIFRSVLQRDVDQRVVLSTAFYFTLAITAPTLIALLLLAQPLGYLLFDTLPNGAFFLRMVFITAALDTIGAVPLARFRIEEKPLAYIALTSGNFALGLVLNIYFVAVAKLGIQGVFMANLVRASLYGVVTALTLLPKLRWVFSTSEMRDLLRFGLPLIPISIFALILSTADRYFLQNFSSMAVVGIYSVGYKLGSLLQLPVGAFQIAWPAIMFSIYKTPQAKDFYAHLLTYFCLVMGAMGLVIAVFAPEAINLIADPQYFEAWKIVPYVVLSQLMLGILYVTAIGVNIQKHPEHIILAWLISVIVHLGINFLIIPAYGMLGAALSTLIAYTLVAVLATIASIRLYPVSYQYARLGKLAIAFTGAYLLSLTIVTTTFGVQSILKVLIILCAPLILFILGFFTKDELKKIRSYAQLLTSRDQ